MKQNCWDFKKCGRGEGGKNVGRLGECPAALEQRLNGIHEGINAGRACWVISGTLCENLVQGNFAAKFKKCLECEFYSRVREEEGSNFCLSQKLLRKLREKE